MRVLMKKIFNSREVILLFTGILIGVIGVYVAMLVADKAGIGFHVLSKDPISTLKGSHLTGLFSSAGIIMMGLCSSVLMTIGVIEDRIRLNKRNAVTNATIGVLVFIMQMDDYLMLHEIFVPYYTSLPEVMLPILYGVVSVIIVAMFMKELSGKGILLFGVGWLFFGFSAMIDTIFYRQHIPIEYVFEDGAKFIGIVLWTLFALCRATGFIQRLNERGSREV